MRKCALPRSWLDNAIRFSTHSRVSGFPRHSFKWARHFSHFLQYTSGLEVLASSFYTGFNHVYAPTEFFLEPPSKVAVKISKLAFRVYSLRQIYNSSSILSWTWGPLSNFLTKCANFWDLKLSILQYLDQDAAAGLVCNKYRKINHLIKLNWLSVEEGICMNAAKLARKGLYDQNYPDHLKLW